MLCASIVLSTEQENVDCSQSPIFSWDRLDKPRLTVTAILIFKSTEGAGVGDYSLQSPIFSWDRLDIPRLTVKAILIFKCTEGAGVRDYSSQSPIFSRDRLDIPRLTVTAILIFNFTKGAGVGDYSPGGGLFFSLPSKPPPPPKENDVSRTDEISFLQTFRVQIRLFLQDTRVYFWLYRGTVYYFIARRFICY